MRKEPFEKKHWTGLFWSTSPRPVAWPCAAVRSFSGTRSPKSSRGPVWTAQRTGLKFEDRAEAGAMFGSNDFDPKKGSWWIYSYIEYIVILYIFTYTDTYRSIVIYILHHITSFDELLCDCVLLNFSILHPVRSSSLITTTCMVSIWWCFFASCLPILLMARRPWERLVILKTLHWTMCSFFLSPSLFFSSWLLQPHSQVDC